MTTQEMKAHANDFVEQVLNNGKFEIIGNYFTADYKDHAAPPGFPPGVEGLKTFFTAFRQAFPDLHYTVAKSICEGNMLVHHGIASGTMKGDFMGMPATGKNATWNEMHILRFDGDRIVEHWAVVDRVSMLEQLGLIPAAAERTA